MKPLNIPTKSKTLISIRVLRTAFLAVLPALLAMSFIAASSARRGERLLPSTSFAPPANSSLSKLGDVKVGGGALQDLFEFGAKPIGLSFISMLPPQAGPEEIDTYATDNQGACTATVQHEFSTGDTVCAKVTNISSNPRRIYWVNPDANVVQFDDVSPGSPSSTRQVAQVGNWRVYLVDSTDGSSRSVATFSVVDPQNPAVDLSVVKGSGDGIYTAGGFARYTIVVKNNGPNTAAMVELSETTPASTTFVGVTPQDAGAGTFTCVPGSPTVCSANSMAAGDVATFVFVYQVDAGAPSGTEILNQADVKSQTQELNSNDNSTQLSGTVVNGTNNPTPCSVACPDDITTPANTTDPSNNPGAVVHFSPPSGNDECGVIAVDHCNDCFFPQGTTTVTATATTGQSCSFTVTVTPSADRPGITCPSNKTADADTTACEVTVNIGTPTVTGNNVIVVAVRSDGKPMYNCDCFPNSPDQTDDSCNIYGGCSRKVPDAPFQAGETTITWTAISHDTAGPYQTPQDEEAHRTGSASCTQTVTVQDVTPPTITATDSTVSADASCQATVPDYSNSASDNCACASSDNSENCQGRDRIVVTQNPAAGSSVGPGAHTIHLTATDEANNTSTKDVTFTVNDTTAPMITCPANITTGSDPGSCSATVNPGTATATDNCDTTPTIHGTRSDNQSLSSPYPKGTTTITWIATDSSGNSSSCTQTVTVNDTENPTISCPAPITKGNDPGVCGAVVTYATPVGSDNCPGATTAQTAGLPSGSTFPVGTTTNTFEVTDTSGNKASCSFTVTVNDVENPVISCPSSQTLEPTCPSGAVATWVEPVGTDNCPGAVTTRTGPAPGSVFPIGTTTVTYTVNDAHGHSASCNFTVTVKTPQATIQDTINAVNATSLNGAQKQGLINKLQQALDYINSGDNASACDRLASFIDKVQGYIQHGDLSAAQGNALINSAKHVRNTLGCTNNPCS
jgi:uncharacterized repeat protein (TIGR01451 family)